MEDSCSTGLKKASNANSFFAAGEGAGEAFCVASVGGVFVCEFR